jgi:hypothetical protein
MSALVWRDDHLNVACSMERELANSEYFGLATRKFAATIIESAAKTVQTQLTRKPKM